MPTPFSPVPICQHLSSYTCSLPGVSQFKRWLPLLAPTLSVSLIASESACPATNYLLFSFQLTFLQKLSIWQDDWRHTGIKYIQGSIIFTNMDCALIILKILKMMFLPVHNLGSLLGAYITMRIKDGVWSTPSLTCVLQKHYKEPVPII